MLRIAGDATNHIENVMLKRISAGCLLFAAILLAFATAGWSFNARAQALSVGFTDHEIVLINMPQYQEVQQQLQTDFDANQQALEALYTDYQDKLERYQRQQSLLSEDRRQEREQELLQLQQQIQDEAQNQDQQLAARQAELMQPLLEQIQDAINEVAAVNSLDIVLRTRVGTEPLLLFVNPETVQDITLDVARTLGLDVDGEAAESSGEAAASDSN